MSQNDKLMQALEKTKKAVNGLLETQSKVLVAIDGRCAAGKTTFAEALGREFSCQVVHMDDFFLRPSQRSKERLAMPGENVDHERFLEEVLIPYKECEETVYRPYDCHTQDFKEPVHIKQGKVLIVEGAYSCHIELMPWYDLHIFLDIAPETQMARIIARNGKEAAKRFEELWIPLEEQYFAAFSIKEQSDICLEI